jgi:threonyl-tRNA synthetase
VTSEESDDDFMMKPMNCPHVTQIYASRPRSFKDLPLRYMETTTMYRDEKSGELHGLSRVRSLTQDDSHAFVRHDQIEDEIGGLLGAVKDMYSTLGMDLRVDLSFRDESDKYFGDPEVWEKAQITLEEQAKKHELNYKVEKGEAAFYGPKIDIYISDSLGREWQCATVQLDFVQPDRFNLEYTDSNGDKQRPAMVHKAILGSIERFLSVYIEHTAGWFPLWLAPEQVRVLPITDTIADYVAEVEAILQGVVLEKPVKYNELRFSVDTRNESLGRKIRDASSMRIPVLIIVGNRDKDQRTVSIRLKDDEKQVSIEELANLLQTL